MYIVHRYLREILQKTYSIYNKWAIPWFKFLEKQLLQNYNKIGLNFNFDYDFKLSKN